MRQMILSQLAAEQTPDMLPLVRESLTLHAARLRPNMAAAAA